MNVFLAEDSEEYEGDTVLGIYSRVTKIRKEYSDRYFIEGLVRTKFKKPGDQMRFPSRRRGGETDLVVTMMEIQ